MTTPVHCITKHDPPHSYGDCLRACIATIMDMPCASVPNFVDHGVDAAQAMQQMRQWLGPHHLAPFITSYPGEPLAEVLQVMRDLNPDSVYVLFGGTMYGSDHCVVCQGGEIVHNPAWAGMNITQPMTNGTWQILVLGRI